MNTTSGRKTTARHKSLDRVGGEPIKNTAIIGHSRASPDYTMAQAEQAALLSSPHDLRHAEKACRSNRDRIGHPAPAKHRGAWSEIVAMSWLIEQGYEVFRNVSATGLADLVAHDFESGKTWLIDVKTCTLYLNKDGTCGVIGSKLSKEQRERNVRPLYVTHDGIVSWDTRLIIGIYEQMGAVAREIVTPGHHISSKLEAQ